MCRLGKVLENSDSMLNLKLLTNLSPIKFTQPLNILLFKAFNLFELMSKYASWLQDWKVFSFMSDIEQLWAYKWTKFSSPINDLALNFFIALFCEMSKILNLFKLEKISSLSSSFSSLDKILVNFGLNYEKNVNRN